MTMDDLGRIQAFLPTPVRTAPAGSTRKPVTPEHTAPSLTFTADVGVAIGQVDRMYQEIRQDFLEARTLDRAKLLDSRTFALPTSWHATRTQLAGALADPGIRVIIVIAPRGYGSTTFVHHMLANHAPSGMKLVELEPDGPRPRASKIRRDPGRAYQLDLKDPQTDRPSTTFLDDLAASVPVLEHARSLWVLNIAADLWTEQRTWPVAPGVLVVELRTPPDPYAVAERRLTAAGMSWLVPYLQSATARAHLSSLRNAVETVRAVGAVAGQWLEFKRDHPEEASWIEEGKLGRPGGAGDSAHHPELRASIENALGDWRTELDRVFAHGGDTGGALSLPDRCLLLSLSLHRLAPAARISRDARVLEELIAKKDRTHAPTNLGQVFAGRGLRQRLTALHATVSSQDIAVLGRPGYAQAVLTYVWDNYEDMRSVLLEWLVTTAPAERAEADNSISALTALAARHQSPTVLTQIRDTAHESGRSDLCAAVMTRVLKDSGMERAAWARLYDWADDRLETQSVVVDVAEHVLAADDPGGRDHRKAMTRLRRVASTSKDRSLLGRVLSIFRRLGHRGEGRNLLLAEVLRWREKKARQSGKIAMLALMAQFDGPWPWLLGRANEKTRTEIDGGLRDLLADPQFEPQAVPLVCAWFKAATTDTEAYAAVRNRVVPALGGQSSRDAGIDLFHQVGRLVLPDGTRVGDDLWAALFRLRRS